jgi:hypothetical protein
LTLAATIALPTDSTVPVANTQEVINICTFTANTIKGRKIGVFGSMKTAADFVSATAEPAGRQGLRPGRETEVLAAATGASR